MGYGSCLLIIDKLYYFVQFTLFLVISNRPRASCSANFEITRSITPWIVLHSVQLLLLITYMPTLPDIERISQSPVRVTKSPG